MAWPFLAFAALGLVATIDLLRGSPAGVGAAAAAPVLLLGWLLIPILRLTMIDGAFGDIYPSVGVLAWVLAVGCGAALVAGTRRAPGPAVAQAPHFFGLVLAASATVWAVGMVLPSEYSGLSVRENLFGGDGWNDLVTGACSAARQ